MIGFLKFIAALPAFFRLFALLEKQIKAAGVNRQVRGDVQTIHEAFDAKDPTKLNHLFSSD